MAVPGLREAASVVRDIDDIPHIRAANAHDLFFLQGYVHADDRMFQMDVSRRRPSGTLAELFAVPGIADPADRRDFLTRWLTNDTYPVRMYPDDLIGATDSVTVFLPARHS